METCSTRIARKEDLEEPLRLPLRPHRPPLRLPPTAHTTQYRYQAGAEDQALTKKLLGWIFEGKLDRVPPAHIFAASPPICKELVERLSPRHVETGSFEQVADDTSGTVSIFGLAAK